MTPATKTIADIIESDSQFTHLARALTEAGIMDSLRQPQGQFTLLAPSDAAFESMADDETRDKIFAGSGCSQDILKHHILPNVICSGVITNKAKTLNALNKLIRLDREEESDDVFVEGAKFTHKVR